jgi:hypothetical protein
MISTMTSTDAMRYATRSAVMLSSALPLRSVMEVTSLILGPARRANPEERRRPHSHTENADSSPTREHPSEDQREASRSQEAQTVCSSSSRRDWILRSLILAGAAMFDDADDPRERDATLEFILYSPPLTSMSLWRERNEKKASRALSSLPLIAMAPIGRDTESFWIPNQVLTRPSSMSLKTVMAETERQE